MPEPEKTELEREIEESKRIGKNHPGGVLEEFIERQDYTVKPPEPLPEDELRKFVIGLCDGTIFTSAHVRNPRDLQLVFLPLALGMFKDYTQKELAEFLPKVGVFWAYMSSSLPRGVNGYPMLTETRMLCPSDWERAKAAYDREMDRRENLSV